MNTFNSNSEPLQCNDLNGCISVTCVLPSVFGEGVSSSTSKTT